MYRDKYGRWQKDRRSGRDRRITPDAYALEYERRRLLRRKANRVHWLHALDAQGKCPFSRGLGCGHAAITQLLVTLAHDEAAAETAKEGNIHEAARRRDVARVRGFIESGADVNDTDSYGLAPLHWAALNGSMDLAKLLINRGANLVTIAHQLGGLTPTGVAKIMGYAELVQFFVSRGGMV
jgi:hypothetical protein